MKKQKLLALGLSLLAVAMIGGTSAFFTASERTHNIITTSGVAIELIENTNQTGVDGRPVPFTNISNAHAGDTYSKIPQVKNIDEGSVWVRVKVAKGATINGGTEVAVSDNSISADFNTQDWLDGGDGYYYYSHILEAGETTEPLFTEVTLADSLSNTYNGATFSLTLQAQAVQVANNGTSIHDAEGWPEE